MLKQNGQKESVISNIHTSANETDKENSLTENIPLENGFTVRRRNNKWFTTLGDTIITEPTEKYTEQLTQIDELNYNLIIKIGIHIYKTMRMLEKTGQTIDKMTSPYETESL